MDISSDGHIHTKLCHHAKGEMDEFVRAGILKGLSEIIFLEHLEVGINYFETTWLTDNDFELYFEEGNFLKDKYSDQIKIGLGVEVGYNPYRIDEILERLQRYNWDRVGISYHFMESKGRHLNLVSRKQVNINALDELGPDKVITAYLKTLTEAVQIIPADVMCHFDAVMRFHPTASLNKSHLELIDYLLDTVKQNKIAIEVNTSGYKYRNEPYPSPSLLKQVVNKGIPLVAASDAHKPEEVGRYFDRLASLSRKLYQ